MLRVIYTSVKSTNPGAVAVAVMAYICLFTFRVLGSIVILGKACDLIDEHKAKQEKKKISVDENRHHGFPKQGEEKKRSEDESKPVPVPQIHQRVETIVHKAEEPEMFQLPDQNFERLFLFQNSCEDRSDVILTNMNSAMIDDDEEDEDNNMDPGTECSRLSDTSDTEDEKDATESLLFSPATKAKSLSSPDLLRREAEDWEEEEEESLLVTAQGSVLAPQTFLPLQEPGARKRDAPGS